MKLNDINKDNIFKVPENYFEELPGNIQERIQKKQPYNYRFPIFYRSLRYALPAIAILFVVLYFTVFNNASNQHNSYEALIEEVSTDDIITYLESQELTAEEIIEHIDMNDVNFDGYEKETDLMMEEDLDDETIDAIIEEYNLDV